MVEEREDRNSPPLPGHTGESHRESPNQRWGEGRSHDLTLPDDGLQVNALLYVGSLEVFAP